MDNNTAYMIVVFSPILYMLLWLSARYYAVYTCLRSKHSKTFLKKNRGSMVAWLSLWRFRNDLSGFVFFWQVLTMAFWIASIVLACVYGALWIFGHQIRHMGIPSLYVKVDTVAACIYVVSIIVSKITNPSYKS